MKLNNLKAFTLVELLLYISILATIIFFSSQILFLLMESRVKNQAISEVEDDGRQVMYIMTQSIRNSNAINSPGVGTSSTSLSINTIVAANNPTVFDLSSGVIRIKEGASGAISLTNSRVAASNLTFRNLSRSGTLGNIKIEFTLSYNNPTGRNEYNYSKTFYGSATIR